MLKVYVGGSFAELATPLLEELAQPRRLESPRAAITTPEWVVTPSTGSRRWLIARAATRLGASVNSGDGIVANWRHEFPAATTTRVLRAHLRHTTGLDADPWALPTLALTMLAWARENGGQESELLRGPDGTVTLERARHYADLFDRYFLWRPELIASWLRGDTSDESEVMRAQRELFNAVHRAISPQAPSPVERWDDAWAATDLWLPELPAPDRVSVFGLSTFPGGRRYIDVLTQLAQHLDVTAYVVDAIGSQASNRPSTKESWTSPTLQMWGGVAASNTEVLSELSRVAGAHWHELTPPVKPTTVLGRLQRTLATDELGVRGPRDASIVEHVTTGDMRQVEILRDAVRHELATTDIEESEILVVCTDVVRYAPLVRSVFGPSRRRASDDPQPLLAYEVADPSVSGDTLFLRAVRHVLSVVRGRAARRDVLSLFEEPALRRRWRLDDSAGELFERWTSDVDIKWGVTQAHRERFGLGALGERNTWAAGLQRLLLGAVIDNPGLRAVSDGILPSDVNATNLGTLGQLSALIGELTAAVHSSWAPKSAVEWLAWLENVIDTFLLAAPDEQRANDQIRGNLERLATSVSLSSATIAFDEFLALLDGELSADGWLGNVTVGGIIITSPETVRWVPYRSIYVIGFDDDAFVGAPLERDDLRRLEMQPGDVLPVDDARGRLAELVLMATDRLTIIRNGADISTGRPVDLATVRAELGDAITAVLEPDTELMSISHARHGFHDDSFSVTAENVEPLRAAGLVRGPWSFSAREFTMNTQRTRTSRASLAALDDEPITLPERLGLDAIERFLRRPAETFVRESLGLVLESNDRPRSDDIAGLIDGWDYSVGLRALLRGDESAERVSTADGFYALTQSGRIPPEPLSNYSTLDAQVRQYREQVEIACDGIAPRVRPFRLTVPVGDRTVSLEGELELYESDSGTRLVEIVESTLSLRALISPWLRTVIARALVEGPLTVHLIARVGSVDATKVVTKIVDIPTDPSTLATLTELLTWYERNLREPLPFDVNWPKRDGGSKIALTEEIIRQQAKWLKSSRAIFMAEPYWRFALGHWSAEELVAGAAGIGVYEMYEQFDALLNRHLPIIDWSDSSNWETGS